jgi:hypothetical protein
MIDRFAFPDELELTRIEVPLASLLVMRERVSSVVAFSVLYGDRPRDSQPQFESLKVHISHLRKKFARLDLHIETLWGLGLENAPSRPRQAVGPDAVGHAGGLITARRCSMCGQHERRCRRGRLAASEITRKQPPKTLASRGIEVAGMRPSVPRISWYCGLRNRAPLLATKKTRPIEGLGGVFGAMGVPVRRHDSTMTGISDLND